MNRSVAFEAVLYGLVVAGIGWFVYQKSPEFGRVTFIAGLAGGGVTALWGVLVLCGYRRRWWMTLALAATGLAMLSQAVQAWMQPAGADGSRPAMLVAVFTSMLSVFSIGLLMNLLHGQGRLYGLEVTNGVKGENRR